MTAEATEVVVHKARETFMKVSLDLFEEKWCGPLGYIYTTPYRREHILGVRVR